jgi:murein DD-endopeptidase MepM/ murein hydrolase activator NlpD
VGPGSVALAAAAALAAATIQANDRAVALTFASRVAQPGELVVVTIASPREPNPKTAVRLTAFGREVRSFPAGNRKWQALVGIDLDVKPGTYPILASVDGITTSRNLVVTAKTFRTRRLTVNPDFVTPPESEAARIAEEATLLERTWASSAAERLWTSFSAPVPQPTNSAFGTRSIFNGTPRNAHGGADFLSPAGTPIAAPSAGRVAVARNLYFSGNTVIVDHGLGMFSMLAHLSAIDVHEGQLVEARQPLGLVGATGRVTGAHLHWAVRLDGARVDPLSVLALLRGP